MTPVVLQSAEALQPAVQRVLEQVRPRLRRLLPDAEIDHIGATSIPGALTKGDIDLVVRVAPEAFASAIDALRGHFIVKQPDNWTAAFASFGDDGCELPLGIQLVPVAGGPDFMTLLRDHLRTHPERLAEYNQLKADHAAQGAESYWQAKNEFITRILAPLDCRVVLRFATPADAPLLRRWDEQPHVIQCDPNDEWNWELELPRTVEWREFLIAEVGGRPVGFMQIIDPAREDSRYWGDIEAGYRAIDIWIGAAADLGRGYGTQMMRLALARCFRDPAVHAVLIDPLAANTRAHRFYERLGFVVAGPRRFGEDDCLVYRLSRDAWRGSSGRRDE